MRSIIISHHHTPPQSNNFHWFSTPTRTGLQRYFPNHVKTKPMALTSSHLVVLAVSPPATTGDMSVLIPTSVAFIFLYWIANFVIPEIIMKDLQSDNEKEEDQNPAA
ncbi:hypothetical protein E3N88_26223 [Mikania micrantha]|uniref:Uncharacterized protein n=1 Tax=Mikania micrantha TaxID=192012 RepID=A0A5N6N737_9ASTR|nr:hypothetical protein E3N88_26223 [Mikania micrantha]